MKRCKYCFRRIWPWQQFVEYLGHTYEHIRCVPLSVMSRLYRTSVLDVPVSSMPTTTLTDAILRSIGRRS